MPKTGLLATRTVALRFPEGETQYWLTDKVFSVGETIQRDGRIYVVREVASTRETGREPRITLEDLTAESAPSDVEERNRQAWNLPAALSAEPGSAGNGKYGGTGVER
jgi:hypothetical protein